MTAPNQLPIDRAFVIGGDTANNSDETTGIQTSYSGNNFGQNFTDDGIRALFEIPAFGLGNAVEVFTQLLLKLPLEALNVIGAVVPGGAGGFTDVVTAVTTIMGSLVEVVVMLPQAVFQGFLDLISGNVGAIPGDVAALLKNGLDAIEQLVDSLLSMLGLGSVGTILDKIFDLADGFDEWFGDSQTSFGQISDLTGNFEDLLGQFFTAFQGGIPDLGGIVGLIGALPALLSNIPTGNVLGVGGPANIGGSIFEF